MIPERIKDLRAKVRDYGNISEDSKQSAKKPQKTKTRAGRSGTEQDKAERSRTERDGAEWGGQSGTGGTRAV